jgi:hypothetical protein
VSGREFVEQALSEADFEELAHFEVEDAETFAAVDEPGADPLVIATDGVMLPVDGFVKVYGAGGSGKTTLLVDWAVHLAAGVPWLGLLEPARPLVVLVLENEGPRAEFRRKLRRRLDTWNELEGKLGTSLGGRLRVLSEPWGAVTLGDERHREELARMLDIDDIDVVIAGPLYSIGMEGGGTAVEIRAFMELLGDVRRRTARPIAFVIVHHENRAGQISGAWEPVPDTLVHVQSEGHGGTRVFWQKVRWSSALHGTTTHLQWADGDSFTVREREEITEDSMVEAMLEATRLLPGGSWTKIRELQRDGRKVVRGNATEAAAVRDRLIKDGRLINSAAREGHFNLWVAEDPAAPRSSAGTGLERARSPSPDGAPEPTRSTVPVRSRERGWERNGSDGPGPSSEAVVTCLICDEPFEPEPGDIGLRCEACSSTTDPARSSQA